MVQQQARLDFLGIECIAEAWQRIEGHPLTDYASTEPSGLAATLLAPPAMKEFERVIYDSPREIKSVQDLRHVIVSHLLSATLKDASFFLHLEPEAKLRWVDLDPKPIVKLPRYAIADAQITESFVSWADTGPLAENA